MARPGVAHRVATPSPGDQSAEIFLDRGWLWRSYGPAEFTQDPDCLGWDIPHRGTKLTPAPGLPSAVHNLLPALVVVDAAVDDNELEDVLYTRPKAFSTYRQMKGR